jgi:hypothetical protein
VVAVAALAAGGCGTSNSSGSAEKTVDPDAPEVNTAGDIPDDQAFVRYTPPGADYSVEVPEGWGRTASGGATTFTDKLNSITMEESAAKSVPAGSTTVARKAGKASLTKSVSKSKPDPVTGKVRLNAVERYVLVHNGKAVVLTLSGPKGADNVDPWRIVTDSLRWK